MMKIKPLGTQVYFKKNNNLKPSSNITNSITQDLFTCSNKTKNQTFSKTSCVNFKGDYYDDDRPSGVDDFWEKKGDYYCHTFEDGHEETVASISYQKFLDGLPFAEEGKMLLSKGDLDGAVEIAIKNRDKEISSLHYEIAKKLEADGNLLIQNGKINEAIGIITKYNWIVGMSGLVNSVAAKFIEQDELDKAIELFIPTKIKGAEDIISRELVRNGRIDEAYKISPDSTLEELISIGRLDQVISLYGEGKLPKPNGRPIKVGDITELLGENSSFEKLAEEKRADASNSAKGVHDDDEWYERIICALGTLGYTEINNIISRNKARKRDLYYTNSDVIKERKQLIDGINFAINSHAQPFETEYEQAQRIKKREIKEETIKRKLQTKFLDFIEMDQDGKPVSEFPNCIMLVGENIPYMQTLIDWTAENADCNYVKIPYNMDNNTLQETLGEKLDEAEENYNKTGERTIIYINGMEKLLSPTKNTDGNIACMKEIMNTADKEYHSTIIFTAKDPSKLDPGTMVSHRVGLRVDVPVSFEETAI